MFSKYSLYLGKYLCITNTFNIIFPRLLKLLVSIFEMQRLVDGSAILCYCINQLGHSGRFTVENIPTELSFDYIAQWLLLTALSVVDSAPKLVHIFIIHSVVLYPGFLLCFGFMYVCKVYRLL